MSNPRFYCPTCKKAVERSGEDFPFCSDRCRQIDLGRWADGSYSIPGESVSIPDRDEDGEPSIH
jgi:hypothetical protein